MTTIGFIGVGVMGAPMARNLLKGGHRVQAYDVSETALTAIHKNGAEMSASARAATDGADFVVSMLPNGALVKEAVFGKDGIAEGLAGDALYIDMSTILPMDTDEVGARLAEMGQAMVDAPVGRSSKEAEEGRLLIMAGGAAEDVERARPVLGLLGDPIIHCGPLGSGSRVKIVNNYQSVALNVLSAESLVLAEASGVDPALAREVMMGTVAGLGHLGNSYPLKVLQNDLEPGFMVDLAHKDMGLALELAARVGAPATMGAVARQVYDLARMENRGRQDWTAIYKTVRRLAGLDTQG